MTLYIHALAGRLMPLVVLNFISVNNMYYTDLNSDGDTVASVRCLEGDMLGFFRLISSVWLC